MRISPLQHSFLSLKYFQKSGYKTKVMNGICMFVIREQGVFTCDIMRCVVFCSCLVNVCMCGCVGHVEL